MNTETQEGIQWAPVFAKGDDRFIVLVESFVADTEEDAWKIGLGASLVELVLWGAKRTNDIVQIVRGEIPHFPAKLAGTPVALLSGPMFDEYTAPIPETPTRPEGQECDQ